MNKHLLCCLGLLPLLEGRAQQYDLRVFTVDDGLPGGAVQGILEDSSGHLLLQTEGGTCRFDGSRFAPIELPPQVAPAGQKGTPGINITGLTHAELMARDGSTWLGTLNGVERITPRQAYLITEGNGLGGSDVRCIYQDRGGSIWIGTAIGGLTRFNGDAFTHFTERDGLNARMVTALHRDPEGRIWFGTNNGYVSYWDGLQVVSSGRPGGTYPAVRAIEDDGEGGLLIATESGLQRLQPTTGKVQILLQGDVVNDALVLGMDDYVLATDKGVQHWFKGGITAVGGTARANALALVNGEVVAGTASGLLATHIGPGVNEPPLFTDTAEIISMATDRLGNLWLGTRGKGVWRIAGGNTRRMTVDDGLASNDIEQVLLDAFDNLWVGTRRGFDHVELDEAQEEVVDIIHYGMADGFISSEALRNACLLDADSTLWFGTARGATHFDPDLLLREAVPPRTRITGLLLDHAPADWTAWSDSVDADGLPHGLRLPYDRNHLTFLFEGISLAFPEKVRYQYILEGLEDEWSPIAAADRVVHAGIPPGEYTFKVIARNASGLWNETPVGFSFTVEPPIYRTTPFIAGTSLGLLLLFWGFVRLRERNARRERIRLEGMVQARTRELEDEKHRSDKLLLNILPETTAAELKERGSAEARHYDACTVLFSDFQGFTSISEQMEARGIVTELDRFFRAFDRITTEHGMEKIKTIGDAYMCAAGVPDQRPSHALDAVKTALDMLKAVDRINGERKAEGKSPWPIRIGLHSGPIVAGVVGEKKFAYDIWGGTVNLASRMESNGAAGHINISGTTYALVMDKVRCTPRGPIKVKGKGEVQMYFVEGLKVDG